MDRILIVDDEDANRFGVGQYLESVGYEVSAAGSLAEARKKIARERISTVLLDVRLPDGDGISFIDEIRKLDPGLPVVVITGYGTIPMAVEAMKKGGDNFLTKPVDMAELEVVIGKCVSLGALRRENRVLRARPAVLNPYIGESKAMKKVMALVEAATRHSSSVLLRGETGTGKGMMARYIHEHGLNASEPFVELNCAGLKGEFLESELFGHSKGAFTGAVDMKKGLLEKAHRGTLFLDEIGDMDLRVQSKFLKVLEEKKFRPLGKVEEQYSKFRLISATHQNLETLMEKGDFRKDLFFRINTLVINLPLLRERLEDLPALASHLLSFITSKRVPPAIHADVLPLLESYHWPGNVRELHNVLERAWILSEGKELSRAFFTHLELPVSGEALGRSEASSGEEAMKLQDAERRHIVRVLGESGGNVPKAAKVLGVSRATLYRKLSKFGISPGGVGKWS